MNLNFKNMKRIIIILTVCICIISFSNIHANEYLSCGKISDYSYDDECDIIVANRNASKQLALTFDDGPCKLYTEEILGILSEYNAKATFFVIGKNAEKYPELVRLEKENGHEIGNHTYSHPEMRKISPEEFEQEITKTQEIIKEITGEYPVLFRPPGGYLSNSIVDKISSNNCRTVLWSWRQDTRDWEKPKADVIVNSVISNIKDGDIILFHDYNTKGSTTPEALRKLLPKLKEMGYEFVTVSELVRI